MDEFISHVEGFLARTGMSASEFGERFARDRGFVFRIRKGFDCGLRRADRIKAAAAEYEKAA